MRIRPDKCIKIPAVLMLCTALVSCGSPVSRVSQTDGDTAYVQEKADNDDTGDVSLKHMPYVEQSGYASVNGGTVYEYGIDQNDEYAVEDNKIILTPMHD